MSSSSYTASIDSPLSHHLSLSFTISSRSSRLHPVSVQSFCRYVLLGRPVVACPCEEVHGRTSLMSSSLLLQQHSSCLVYLIWMLLEIGGRWSYNCVSWDVASRICSIICRYTYNVYKRNFDTKSNEVQSPPHPQKVQ